jgi:hypothetical protein
MPWPHDRQRPRSTSHEITGMLSRFAISVPHRGHRDLGRTTLSPAGTRETTTVMKLPTASPNGKAMRPLTHASLIVGDPTLARSPRREAQTSRTYEMLCSNPWMSPYPGTNTGLKVIVNWFSIDTFAAST